MAIFSNLINGLAGKASSAHVTLSKALSHPEPQSPPL